MRMLMALGIAMAFVVGYKIARFSGGVRNDGVSIQSGPTTGFEDSIGVGGGHQPIAAGSWQEVKERVVKRWGASPAVMVDFELREETMRLLEKASVADLETWLRELRPDSQKDDDQNIPLQLREMILMTLAPRGGGPLILSLAEHPMERGWHDVDLAMFYWTRSDPAAVLDWLDGDVPNEIKEDVDSYRESALENLAGKDPPEFERRLSKVNAETREDVLEDYAYRRGTEEDRAGLLARAASSPHGEAMALWKGLLRCEGSDEPKRAYATLKELEVSADDRATLDQVLVSWLLRDHDTAAINRCGVMQAWVERNPGQEVPERIRKSFDDWSGNDRDRAIAWIAEQPPGPQYDAFAQLVIKQRPGEHEEIAKMASRISDEILRGTVLRQLKASWQAKDSAAATEWEKNLSEADRERLK